MSAWQDRLPAPDPTAIARHLQLPDTDEVDFHFCRTLGRVLFVTADAGKLALGVRHFRTANRESGWDVDVMSREEFEHRKTWYRQAFCDFDYIDSALADRLVAEGYLSFDDLSVIDRNDLRSFGESSATEAEHIIEQAETKAEELHRR